MWCTRRRPGIGGVLEWVGRLGAGSTPEAAVNDLLPLLSAAGPMMNAATAPIGYRDASTQTWIASTSDGRPSMVIGVAPNGSAFTAGPQSFCAR